MVESAGAARKTLPRWLEAVIIVVSILVILAILLPPSMITPRSLYNQATCSNNLSQIGKALHVWAAMHHQNGPDAYNEDSKYWYKVGNTRTDRWDPVENNGSPPKAEPGDNGESVQSNTANFWLMMSAGLIEKPEALICPSSRHQADISLADYTKVRDFRGETFCSYSFQNVLGEYVLSTSQSPKLAVATDANPLRRDFWSGGPEGNPIGETNKKLAEKPKFEVEEWNKTEGRVRRAWELNSPNHNFKGQNVLYLDGHVEFQNNPYCGYQNDNLWLRRKPGVEVERNPADLATLRAYNDETSYDGSSTLPADNRDDSFLVP